MKNDFFSLLTYCSAGSLDHYSEYNAHRELDFYFQHLNDEVYDLINYERLIYIEIRFNQDPEIMTKLNDLKYKICKNYILRQKLINRLELQEV